MTSSEKKFKVAVTGGIGGGKSEFCSYLKSKGFTVISADKEAKTILSGDPAVKAKIIKSFGPESFAEDKPNIPYLAEKVFSDPTKVKKINSIIHPVVIKKIEMMMDKHLKKENIVFVEAALIYEASMEEMFDYVVLVTASEDIKINRIQQRDKASVEEIKSRMENQISDDIKRTHADFTFDNNSSLADLHAKADFLLTLLGSMGGTK